MERHDFIQVWAAAAVPPVFSSVQATRQLYAGTRLVDSGGWPLRASVVLTTQRPISTPDDEMLNEFLAKHAMKHSPENGCATKLRVSAKAMVSEPDRYCRQ